MQKFATRQPCGAVSLRCDATQRDGRNGVEKGRKGAGEKRRRGNGSGGEGEGE